MEIAAQLNKKLSSIAPLIFNNLSSLGKRAYFPKGILAQSQEAKTKATLHNATIGIAISQKQPMHLSAIKEHLPMINIQEAFTYSPSVGNPKLRQIWKNKILADNPSLQENDISLPIATCGITQAISLTAKMFVEKGDKVVIPEQNWENYDLIFNMEREASIASYPLFNQHNKFNITGLDQTLTEVFKHQDKALVVLNFPNNPTGYSLLQAEQTAVVDLIKKFANTGKLLIILCDDAYFGLFFDPKIANESIFAKLANAHPNILAIKADGATKEYYVWGFRVGFISFGCANNEVDLYEILSQKIAGLIRADISNVSQPVQTILEKIIENDNYRQDSANNFDILQKRAHKMQAVLQSGNFADEFLCYPFNSGYFMCLRLKNVAAEELRKKLLDEQQIGTISFGEKDLRVAFSSVEEEQIEDMMHKIYKTCQQMKK